MHLGTGPKEHYVRPAANALFRSAAIAYGSRVIGVVLTGLDQDGTTGLQEIKQRGGITIVQDPAEAAWSSMPQHAVTHVDIDYITPLGHIASLLCRLVDPPGDTATM